MKRKPRFKVGQVVCVRNGNKAALTGKDIWYPVRIIALPVPEAGWGYQLAGLYGTIDAPEENLRPLTARERRAE